ncbi:MAG: ABC transporter permease [Actinomycetota bacterium]|nr:ABC transporter permease [Actinomycetota bacterium]
MLEKLRELINHRELLWNMTVKELKVKYKRSVLGFLWSFASPIIMLAVFSVVFTILVPSENMKWFVVYLMAGLLPWLFFVNSLMQSVGTIVGNAALVKKVYFPREILPLSAVGANIFHFLLQLLVFFVFLLLIGWKFSIWFLCFPLLVLLEVLFTTAIAIFVSAANVYLRDIQHFVEVLTMAWFWITPIVYPVGLVRAKLAPNGLMPVYLLNPMAHIILSWQYIIYNPHRYAPMADVAYVSFWGLLGTGIGSAALLLGSCYFFMRMERGFAEQI